MNPILKADSYTISGNCLVSAEARQRSSYYMANRYSPVKAWPTIAQDDRMVFWGLSQYIENNLKQRITHKDVLDAMRFMDQAKVGGNALKFDYKMWQRVVDEYDGYLPITIEALPEGSIFYPHQPMVQVSSLGDGFGEIAAHVEAVLVGTVSIGTGRATMTGHWYEHIVRRMMKLGYTEDEARAKAVGYIHDFGMRASSTEQESMLMGLAHLLFFVGTDTFNAAYKAFSDGVTSNGKSILALAHRVVQSYENEQDAYTNLSLQDNIGSYVADCYDYKRAVERDLVQLALIYKDKIIVARPDSGDEIENALFLCRKAEEHGLCVNGRFGLKDPKNLLMIEGNSVNPTSLDARDDAIIAAGYNPYNFGIYGVGGFLRNSVTRDSLSSAFKLNSVGAKRRPVMKFSEVETKESIPGEIQLVNGVCESKPNVYSPEMRDSLSPECGQQLITYYKAGKIAPWVGNFKDAYDRVQRCWTQSPKSMSRETIVAPMQDTINQLRKKYKG